MKRTATVIIFEVVLAVWGRGSAFVHSSKKTCWIDPEKERPHFTFSFAKPPYPSEYMICLRISFGYNNKEIDYMPTQGTVIWQTGSFIKRDKALLAEKIKARHEEQIRIHYKKTEHEGDRVMPDRYV